MSAFIVGHDHINALMTWAVDHRVSYWNPEARQRVDITRATAEEVGRILLHENEVSVRYRYPGDAAQLPGTIGEDADTYVFRATRPGMLSAVAVIKAVHCLEYQSCEHPGWEASLAWRICQALKDEAADKLPGYDAAAWEIRAAAEA